MQVLAFAVSSSVIPANQIEFNPDPVEFRTALDLLLTGRYSASYPEVVYLKSNDYYRYF